MLLPSIIYVAVFGGIWFITFGILIVIFESVIEKLQGYKITADERGSNWYLFLMIPPLFVAYFGLAIPFDYRPPSVTVTTDIVSTTSVDEKLSSIDTESLRIQEALSNIDDLTIRELRSVLGQTLTYMQNLQFEAKQHEQLISGLRKAVSQEKQRAVEAKKMADAVATITEPQLEAIKALITIDATHQSNRSFWFGVLVSFPIGLTASLLASFMAKWISRMRGS